MPSHAAKTPRKCWKQVGRAIRWLVQSTVRGKELEVFKVGSMMRTKMNTIVSENCDLAINENNHR